MLTLASFTLASAGLVADLELPSFGQTLRVVRSEGFRRLASADDWADVIGDPDCITSGLYFDPTVQRCLSCSEVDTNAVLRSDISSSDTQALEQGAFGQCKCASGYVQCPSGQTCTVDDTATKVTEGPFKCLQCPTVDNSQTAPTEDLRSCLPCFVDSSSSNTTLGFSEDTNDCLCPAGYALSERSDSGDLLNAKICVKCSDGLLGASQSEPSSTYVCGPCDDPERMERDTDTGECVCKTGQTDGSNYVEQGGSCIAVTDYNSVNTRFPVSSAKSITFRDLIDGRETMFENSPFGETLGVDSAGDNMKEVLALTDTTRTESPTVSSSTMEWLYIRCSADCLNGNATACQCVSNLCVLMLYEDTSTVCRFLTNYLYEGRETINYASLGSGFGVEGMPWLLYQGQTALQIVSDASLTWKYTLADDPSGQSDVSNTLVFWLAKYSLGGAWLGWESLTDQLDLCLQLGGTSDGPQSPSSAWRRFASSLVTKCTVPLLNILKCGANPYFYELFIEDVSGALLPVPVRILNLIKDQDRPNLNYDSSVWSRQQKDISDDVLVRRFTLCDSMSGRGGSSANSFLDSSQLPVVFRWAAHMLIDVSVRPDEGQIYVPVLSIAYAEKKTANLGDGDLTHVSFKAEYSMDASGYWTVMLIFFCLVCAATLFLTILRMYLISCRYPSIPLIVPGGDLNLFLPRLVLQVQVLLSTGLTLLFWFHWLMSMYWLVVFKAQDAPFILLPSAIYGNNYEPHDALMITTLTLVSTCLILDLAKHMKVVIFLVDWERGEPTKAPNPVQTPMPNYGYGMGQVGMGQPLFGGQAGRFGGHSPPHFDQQTGSMSRFGDAQGQAAAMGATNSEGNGNFADQGVSAWRTLFVANQLNQRLSSTRLLAPITWLCMLALLEGMTWKNAARWYPRFTGDDNLISSQFNPFLQFALGTSLWLAIIFLQLVIRRVASVFIGDELHDFVDICSTANVSVLLLDEPFHGFYIHGKAPGGRGELCHSELSTQLHREEKGIGLPRGLTLDDCQTFELYLPPDLSVQISGGSPMHFRQMLYQIFGGVNSTLLTMKNRRPARPEPQDVAEMTRHRCRVQSLVDSLVHAVMRRANDVVQDRTAAHWFWGLVPQGGVAALRQPIFWKDNIGLAWAACLAYGSEIRALGLGLPSGFEWHLALLELFSFQMTWRFQGSITCAAAVAFLVNQTVLTLYAVLGSWRLAHTTLINSIFFVGAKPGAQGLLYIIVFLMLVIHEASS